MKLGASHNSDERSHAFVEVGFRYIYRHKYLKLGYLILPGEVLYTYVRAPPHVWQSCPYGILH